MFSSVIVRCIIVVTIIICITFIIIFSYSHMCTHIFTFAPAFDLVNVDLESVRDASWALVISVGCDEEKQRVVIPTSV